MRTKYVIRNMLFNLILQMAIVISGFVFPKVILSYYGSEINGLRSSITQFLNYFALVEGGLGTASIVALYKPLAIQDNAQVSAIFKQTKRFFLKIGMGFALLVLILASIYPIFIKGGFSGEFAFALIVMVGVPRIINFLIIEKYKVLFNADQKMYITSCLQAVGIICNIIFYFIIIKLHGGILLAESILGILNIIIGIILCYICKAQYPFLNIEKKTTNIKIGQKGAVLIHKIASMISSSTDIAVLTICSTLKEVSVYSVYYMVFQGVQSIMGIVFNAVSATFGNIIAEGETKTLQKTFNIYTYLYYLITAVSSTCMIILYAPFINLFTEGIVDVIYIRPYVAELFVIILILNNVRFPGATLIGSAGHYNQTKVFFIVEALINLSISLVLVGKMGIIGCLVGTICSCIFRFFFVTVYSYKKILKFSFLKLAYRWVYNSLGGFLSFVIIHKLFIINITDYISFFGWGILLVAVSGGICGGLAFLLEPEERNELLRKVKLYKG